MPGVSKVLREIHRLRRHARDLQEQLDRAPIQLKAQKNRVAKADAALADAQDALKKLKVATHEKEVTLRSTHQQIEKYERQKNEAGGSKAYEALGHEIAAARQKAQALEDDILDAMSQAEERAAGLPDLEASKKKVAGEFAAFERDQKDRLARLSGELKATLDQLKAVEAEVPEDIRPQYQRLVN